MLMIACFSLDPDVLSQWRAYGNDGRGFAIGFSKTLMEIPAKPLRVLYDEDAQMQELLGNLRHIYKTEQSFGFKYDERFKSHLFHLGLDLCAYKHPGFKEEQEIRLARFCGLVSQEGRIMPAGALGPNDERLSEPLKTHFRMRNGFLIPYVIIDYSNKGAAAPIKEIVLGPTNVNDELNVKLFITDIGLPGVVVRRCKIPYYGS